MPKKTPIVEAEQEIDIKTPKRETFATRWFADNAVNNRADLKIICDLTARSAQEQFDLHLPSGNTELYALIFYATFMTILDFIREKEKLYNAFSIEIANSVNLGFTNNSSEDNEKVGNFMPLMEYIGINRNIVGMDLPRTQDRTNESFIQWKELNIKKTVDYYKEIQEKAFNRLNHEFHTDARTSECIIPLFCIFMDNIVSVMKMRFKEAAGTDISEVSMNVLGLFDAFYSYDPDTDQEVIEFAPNITMKLALKSDDTAAR